MEVDPEEPPVGEADITWAARLVKERDRLGLKSEDLAELAGVHRTTMFMYLKGARAPDAPVLAKLLSGGVDVLYVLSGRRERRGVEDIGEEARDLLGRYNSLPPKLRDYVDKSLHLSHLAYSDRKRYHEEDEAAAAQVSIKGKGNKVGHVAARDITIHAPAKKPKR